VRVKVLGAGIAGLTAAYQLQKRGHEVVVIERSEHAGGNIRSERIGGSLIEWGPNGFLDSEPATLQLIDELGLNDHVVRAREAAARRFIWRAGKLRELPMSPLKFLTGDLLPLPARLRVLCMPFTKRAGEGDESIHTFAARRLGKGAADILVDAFVTGVFAGDPKRLSLKSCLPKIANAKGMPKGGPKGRLTSFDEGLQVLIDELKGRVDVRFGEQATTLDREDFDHVVCTIPARHAAKIAGDTLAAALEKIPTAPVAVVATVFKEPLDVPDVFGFLVPHGQQLRILGTLYDSSIYPGRAPEGKRLFRTMIGGRRDPDAVGLPDKDLQEIVARDLHTVWGHYPEPEAVHVIRHPLGIAQYETGHSNLLAGIESATPNWLRLAGSSYRGVALNACVKEALDWSP